MNALTNKEIISEAKHNTRMVYCGQSCGHDSYKLQDWIDSKNAWYESSSQYFYSSAKSHLKESYIENICSIVYLGDYCAYDPYYVHDYSDWRQFARIIINTARKNKRGIFAE